MCNNLASKNSTIKCGRQVILNPEELNWLGVRFLDLLGKVFSKNGSFYRAVYPEASSYVDMLFEKGILDELYDLGFTCKFNKINTVTVDGYAYIVEQDPSCYDVAPDKWNRYILRDAAIVYLKMNKVLLRYGLGLKDGHPGNFAQFGNAQPKWFDLGSIVPLRMADFGVAEFCKYFLFPLLVANKGKHLGRIARVLVGNGGLQSEEILELLNIDLKLGGDRGDLLDHLLRVVNELSFGELPTLWSDYHNPKDFDGFVNVDFTLNGSAPIDRNQLVYRYLKLFKPEKVIDIGCNMGLYSLLAARHGAKVWGFDTDEASSEKFYHYLKNSDHQFDISISLGDIASVNMNSRNVADLVFAMALSHHVFISQRFSFDVFAENVASYSRNALVTEFMPNGLGGAAGPKPNPLPKGYTLDNMVNALMVYFEYVEAIEYPVPEKVSPRTFIVCSGKYAK